MDAESLEMLARSSCTAHPQSFGGAPAESSCKHEHSHIVDSKTHGGGYAGPVSRRIFCSHCRLQRWLDVEAALALAQADVGVIPPEAALEIAKAARLSAVDLQQIADGVASTGHSLMPLLGALQRNCSPSAREYVHFGATTQDIQDTAQSLEMRDVLDETERALDILLDRLSVLASGTRNALMVARTHSIPALPTTFGLKVAGWIDELLRHRERLGEARKRILVVQLFGGVGTMAAFGDEAMLPARKLRAAAVAGRAAGGLARVPRPGYRVRQHPGHGHRVPGADRRRDPHPEPLGDRRAGGGLDAAADR
ncbi:adenylosuccinate lyase [Pseudomonas aeruginosa]|nr:adenylosuccinate lyase [Pseudomonas aeruginosa]